MKFLDAYCITSDIMKNFLQRMNQVAAENPDWENPEWKRSNPEPYTKTVYENISEILNTERSNYSLAGSCEAEM